MTQFTAGTGKSTLLDYFRNTTRKKAAVLAPTGVAALNILGQTIHSFCRFKPDITLEKVKKISGKGAALYKNLDAVVIDEISMVRADLLDCVEKFLRLNGPHPRKLFGGHGQVYVALSRCTSFPGIVLKKEIRKPHIRMDWRIIRFLTRYQYRKADEKLSYADKRALIHEAIPAE